MYRPRVRLVWQPRLMAVKLPIPVSWAGRGFVLDSLGFQLKLGQLGQSFTHHHGFSVAFPHVIAEEAGSTHKRHPVVLHEKKTQEISDGAT